MLFIRNLRLTLQILQNGLIIFVVWNLMRMVIFLHDYDKCDDFAFPIVNFPYLSSVVPESLAYGVFVSQLIRYVQIYSRFKVIEAGIFFTETSNFSEMTLFTNLTLLCHIC